MSIIKLALLSLVLLSPVILPVNADQEIKEEFVASSPCEEASKVTFGIPITEKCELIKWELTLSRDKRTDSPTTFKLIYAYGLTQPNTNEVANGGTKVERMGRWSIVQGTVVNPTARVYQLDGDKSQPLMRVQVLSDDLLHLLDKDGRLMVGNGGWSFTLNRAQVSPTGGNRKRFTYRSDPGDNLATLGQTRHFVGRTPCTEIAALLNRKVDAACIKSKWDFTFSGDPASSVGTYKVKNIFVRDVITKEGRWVMVKGTKTDPDAVIFQIDPDDPHHSINLLQIDENLLLFLDGEMKPLVGNRDFSYTLNLVKPSR